MVILLLCALVTLAGCGRPEAPVRAAAPVARAAPAAPPSGALPLDPGRERLAAMVVDSLQKRVMGRRASLRDVERIVTEVAPIVAAASRQPWAQGPLRRIARDNGISPEEARRLWTQLQEADLLLESGGDPDAVSVSDAVGVAQWLAPTASGNGLPVNVAASKRLTKDIDALKWRIAWLEYLLRPDADPRAPGAPRTTRADAAAKLPALRRALETLRARRRGIDARYDPRKAIFAQTRYLLRLYDRFPSPDWLFQAYHGGEAGVQRTLRQYFGPGWPGSAAAAIRRGRAGRPLRFEDLYFTTTPRSRPAAFAYLYGRSDDHRYYWWKLRAARESIALYRRDAALFRRRWEAYLPGRAKEAHWYPDAPAQALADLSALRSARAGRRLLPVGERPEFSVRPAPLDPQRAPLYAALRPEARGALILVAAAHRRAGGSGRLTLGDLAITPAYADRARALHPPARPKGPPWPPEPGESALPGGGPPPDFDFHRTGLAFDILRPSGSGSRKTLLYALGYLADRQILWWVEERYEDGREPRYHVVPSPRYAATLAGIGASGQAPRLPAL